MLRQTTFEQIQSLCRDFRRQLKNAAPVCIEDYLDRVEARSRQMLFQNLLHIDIEFQRRQQRHPSSDKYIARFPDYASQVRNAFLESTLMSQSPLVDTPAIAETHVFAVPAARKLGEYELLKELGRGSFGVVYEARHLQRQAAPPLADEDRPADLWRLCSGLQTQGAVDRPSPSDIAPVVASAAVDLPEQSAYRTLRRLSRTVHFVESVWADMHAYK